MAEVVRLDEVRNRKRGVIRAPAPRTPTTGGLSLLWRVAGTGEAHRRVPGHGAACGARGALVLAEPGSPPCRACWGQP